MQVDFSALLAIDYRELLKAYMRHVGEIEGVDFLFRKNDLNQEQYNELLRLSQEIADEY